jgi:cytochrome bd ubiquinol oxidase subunit I
MLSAEFISRVQFAFTISFHILFPAFSIGLATFLFIMEGVWLKTKNIVYYQICRFWTKVFALTFGMGVVSGVVMEFQFGTNWSRFTNEVGPVLGAFFTWEVLTAFFIEAGFLGVMVFGWKKVSKRLHYLATILVFLGVTLSAFWIMTANSWMQTPAGYIFEKGQFTANHWLDVIFTPSLIPRYSHMMLATYLSTLFVIISVSSFYLLKKKHIEISKKCIKFASYAALILMLLQLFIGDMVGRKVHEYQPIKTAAIEGVWNTTKGAPLLLFAIPDQAKQENKYAIGIPYGASIINTHSIDGELVGLKTVPPSDQPEVAVVFWTFRIMVGFGLVMLLLSLISSYLVFRNRVENHPWFLKVLACSFPLGFLSLETGWITAEVGRQPWIVYGLMRTKDAVSLVTRGHVIMSFVLIILVYGVIFVVFYTKYLRKLLRQGPEYITPEDMEVSADHPFNYLATGISENLK